VTNGSATRVTELARCCAAADAAGAARDSATFAASVRAAVPLVIEDLTSPLTAVCETAVIDIDAAVRLWSELRLRIRHRRSDG
jgi:hypothetical protein